MRFHNKLLLIILISLYNLSFPTLIEPFPSIYELICDSKYICLAKNIKLVGNIAEYQVVSNIHNRINDNIVFDTVLQPYSYHYRGGRSESIFNDSIQVILDEEVILFLDNNKQLIKCPFGKVSVTDENHEFLTNAIDILIDVSKWNKNAKFVDFIIENINNENDFIRYSCICEIDNIDNTKYALQILKLTESKTEYSRILGLYRLKGAKTNIVLPKLIDIILNDPSNEVKSTATNTLRSLSDEIVLSGLKNESDQVRLFTVKYMSNSKKNLKFVIDIGINDENKSILSESLNILKKFSYPGIIPKLEILLKKVEDDELRDQIKFVLDRQDKMATDR